MLKDLILFTVSLFPVFFQCNVVFTMISQLFRLVNYTFRGPTFGNRGKVVLAFDDNPSSKIGVRFDKLIPDGVDLGGLCEGGHGFFCNGNDLMCYCFACSLSLCFLHHSQNF